MLLWASSNCKLDHWALSYYENELLIMIWDLIGPLRSSVRWPQWQSIMFYHLELGLMKSRVHDSDAWTGARCMNKWLSPSCHLTVMPLFQPTTIYEHSSWPANSRKKLRCSPSMDLLNILSWAEKADYCHNKTSFIVLKNSSKGKSFQWRRATKGTTDQLFIWRGKLLDVKICMWSWAEVKGLVVGQGLGKTRLETNHVKKSYVDTS